jgi:hypothetical protein
VRLDQEHLKTARLAPHVMLTITCRRSCPSPSSTSISKLMSESTSLMSYSSWLYSLMSTAQQHMQPSCSPVAAQLQPQIPFPERAFAILHLSPTAGVLTAAPHRSRTNTPISTSACGRRPASGAAARSCLNYYCITEAVFLAVPLPTLSESETACFRL